MSYSIGWMSLSKVHMTVTEVRRQCDHRSHFTDTVLSTVYPSEQVWRKFQYKCVMISWPGEGRLGEELKLLSGHRLRYQPWHIYLNHLKLSKPQSQLKTRNDNNTAGRLNEITCSRHLTCKVYRMPVSFPLPYLFSKIHPQGKFPQKELCLP